METVFFRDFEQKDVDFVLKCKNNENLFNLSVGSFKPLTYSEAKSWVQGCMEKNDSYKFWAICTNDASRQIIGWASLADIDFENKSASTHSIVIGSTEYNDGIAWIETVLFMFEYAFDRLNLNRLYGISLVGHKMSNLMGDLMFMTREGVLRQAVYKNGRYYDLLYNGILRDEYYTHKENGDYEMKEIIRRLRKLRHG